MFSRITNFFRNINYLTKNSLWDKRESDILYLSNKIISDVKFDYHYSSHKNNYPVILNKNDSFSLLKSNPKSIARFGDGEIKIMMGINQPFQEYDNKLAERMISMIKNNRSDIYIAINSGYFDMTEDNSSNFAPYYLRHGFDFRNFFLRYLDVKKTYLSTRWTDLWLEHNDENSLYVDSVCDLFKDKDIFLVAGEGVTEKLKFDVFYKAKSKVILHGPSKNAFRQYDSILKEIIRKSSKDQLICLILGMTSKVLVEDLTDLGYLAFDVGHLAKYYDAYMSNLPRNSLESQKFFAPD